MKKATFWVILALVVGVFTAEAAFAASRPWRGSGGWGSEGPYQRMYNPATTESISGTVMTVEKYVPLKGMNYGIHLLVKTEKETIPVHLGPAWYVERQDTKIVKGDKVAIRGSRVQFEGKPAIIAQEVRKGDAVLTLRDEKGNPAWAAWRRR